MKVFSDIKAVAPPQWKKIKQKSQNYYNLKRKEKKRD